MNQDLTGVDVTGIVKIIQQAGVTGLLIVISWFLGKMLYKLYKDNKDFRDNNEKRIDDIRTNYESKLEQKNNEQLSMLEKVLIMVSDNEKTLKDTVVLSDKEILNKIENTRESIVIELKRAIDDLKHSHGPRN